MIQHWLNGKKVVDFDDADPQNAEDVANVKQHAKADFAARGAHLRLQDHGNPVWFRAIKLRAGS